MPLLGGPPRLVFGDEVRLITALSAPGKRRQDSRADQKWYEDAIHRHARDSAQVTLILRKAGMAGTARCPERAARYCCLANAQARASSTAKLADCRPIVVHFEVLVCSARLKILLSRKCNKRFIHNQSSSALGNHETCTAKFVNLKSVKSCWENSSTPLTPKFQRESPSSQDAVSVV